MVTANAKPHIGRVRDRVAPISQYAGALWKNIGRVLYFLRVED